MSPRLILIVGLICLSAASAAHADDFSYEAIAERFSDTQLDANSVEEAKMHGECMVGLKHLIFVPRHGFDPVAEWVNYRTYSLLEQFPPYNVLIMMEVARKQLMSEQEQEQEQEQS